MNSLFKTTTSKMPLAARLVEPDDFEHGGVSGLPELSTTTGARSRFMRVSTASATVMAVTLPTTAAEAVAKPISAGVLNSTTATGCDRSSGRPRAGAAPS